MANNVTYLNNVDSNRVNELLNSTSSNVEYFNNITNQTAKSYTADIDELMIKIYKDIKNADSITTDKLESYFLELTNLLYFMGDRLEQLGVFSDMSKAAQKEIYNKAYLANQVKDIDKKNKTTVAENQAVAEQESQYESVVNSVYDHAYKIVKFKIDAGFEMVNTLKKIISRRMQDESLSMYQNKNFGIST